MITARDLHRFLQNDDAKERLNKELDSWLKEIVFPHYLICKGIFAYTFNREFKQQDVVEALQQRGFSVTIKSHSPLTKNIKLVLPPQGD